MGGGGLVARTPVDRPRLDSLKCWREGCKRAEARLRALSRPSTAARLRALKRPKTAAYRARSSSRKSATAREHVRGWRRGCSTASALARIFPREMSAGSNLRSGRGGRRRDPRLVRAGGCGRLHRSSARSSLAAGAQECCPFPDMIGRPGWSANELESLPARCGYREILPTICAACPTGRSVPPSTPARPGRATPTAGIRDAPAC